MNILPPDWRGRVTVVATSLGLVCLGLAVAIATILLGSGLLTVLGVNVQDPAISLPVQTILQALGTGLTVGGYLKYTGRTDLIPIRRPTMTDMGWVALGVVGLLLVQVGLGVILNTFGISSATNHVETIGSKHPMILLYMIPLAFIAIGPGEELLFRGVVQGKLATEFSNRAAIVGASALFGLMHFLSLSGSGAEKWVYMGGVFALSLILGVVHERTQNIIVPSLVHGAYDAVVFLSLYVQLTATSGL